MADVRTRVNDFAIKCYRYSIGPSLLILMLGILIAIFVLALIAYRKPFSALKDKNIEIVAAFIPPNIKEDGQGREADIIRSALKLGDVRPELKTRSVRFHVEPFGKHWYSYETDDRFDAVATVPTIADLRGHTSKFYIMYRNGVGVLDGKGAQEPITNLEQMDGERVISFAGAAQVIPGLKELVKRGKFKAYLEREDQRTHSWMLLNGKVDAVIADAMIFSEFNDRIFADGKAKRHAIQFYSHAFMPTCYTMVFRNAEYRDQFDDGLRKMIDGGQLYQIDQNYMTAQIRQWDVQYLMSKGEAPCHSK
jgi:polar amino acid transport system substrate-binding protein